MNLSPGRFFLHPFMGLLLLILLILPIRLYRGSLETSIWIDETYTLMLSSKSVAQLVDTTRVDAHPPLYYLLVKGWLGLVEWSGFPTGIGSARGVMVLFWILLLGGIWFPFRKIFGEEPGTWFVWVVAVSAQIAHSAREMRNYGVAIPFLAMAFLLLVMLERDRRDNNLGLWVFPAWAAYSLCCLAASWCHILSFGIAGLQGVCWMLTLFYGPKPRRWLVGGLVSNVVIVIGYLPWLTTLMLQIRFVNEAETSWMTPATIQNLMLVFCFWFPFGRFSLPEWWVALPSITVGVLVHLVALRIYFSHRERYAADRVFPLFASLVVGVGFPLVLWTIHLLEISRVFHGPRYPTLSVVHWLMILFSLMVGFGEDASRIVVIRAAALFMIVIGVTSDILAIRAEQTRGPIPDSWDKMEILFPRVGEPLFVFPSNLIPYYQGTFAEMGVSVVPVARIGKAPRDFWAVTILDLNPHWKGLNTVEDLLFERLLRESRFSSMPGVPLYMPHGGKEWAWFYFRDFDLDVAEVLLQPGLKKHREIPGPVLCEALPEDQLHTDGWSVLETDSAMSTFRWGVGGTSKLRFSRRVGDESGSGLIFVLEGFRQPHPEPEVEFRLVFSNGTSHEQRLGPGHFVIKIPHKGEQTEDALTVTIHHPSWKPSEIEKGNQDRRPLTFLFYGAWIIGDDPEPTY